MGEFNELALLSTRALALRSSVPPELASDVADVSPRVQGRPNRLLYSSTAHTMLCCQMGVKSLKMPPANQAFNRIAAEITLDLATRPKDRSSLGPYHPHLIACLG